MPGPIGASPTSTEWAAASPLGATTAGIVWTAGPVSPGVVGPVYFLYGGASVWTLVR
jgi:hypothetical protein